MGAERLRTSHRERQQSRTAGLCQWPCSLLLPDLPVTITVAGRRACRQRPPGRGTAVPSSCALAAVGPALTPVPPSPFPLLSACQLNCSDHGHCDSFTKRCICDPFWMENFIKVQLRDGDSNCGESSARQRASGFGAERSSELSRWVVVFPRQMSKRGELCVCSVCRGLLLPSSTLLQVRAGFCSRLVRRTRLKSDRVQTAA